VYRFVDVARRVVGVGSVGTLVWVYLPEGSSRRGDERVVLQVKQGQASVLEPHLPAELGHEGRRVVAGQRSTRGPTGAFLGWCEGPRRRHCYVRQLWAISRSSSEIISRTSGFERRPLRSTKGSLFEPRPPKRPGFVVVDLPGMPA
jgi:hypothetical protein